MHVSGKVPSDLSTSIQYTHVEFLFIGLVLEPPLPIPSQPSKLAIRKIFFCRIRVHSLLYIKKNRTENSFKKTEQTGEIEIEKIMKNEKKNNVGLDSCSVCNTEMHQRRLYVHCSQKHTKVGKLFINSIQTRFEN